MIARTRFERVKWGMLKIISSSFIVSLALATAVAASPPGPIRPLAPKAMLSYTNGSDVVSGPAIVQADMIAALKSVEAHGLNPADYHLDALTNYGTDGDMAIYAVDAWMSAASHIAFGKLSPKSVEPDWTAKGREANLSAHLREALANGTLVSSLDRLAPQHMAYQSLTTELAGRLAGTVDDLPVVPSGVTLKSGMTGPRVTLLQTRLDLEATGTFDEETVAAVKTFQTANDLDDDGAVGPATLRVLNRNRTHELDQLRVNLERWRWLPDDLGQKHVRVNIADFSVQAWQNGQIDRVHGAIVGKTYRKTPIFSDVIEYVVINPWWETPYSLASRDKLPLFKRDPSAVQRLGFQVLDQAGTPVDATTIDWTSIPAGTMPYRLRQSPGPVNALGQVKIMFPNVHNVYLHDTPDRGLFAQRQRAFSSGCIRTQNPLELTAWLLSDKDGWDRARIDQAVESKRETRVDLVTKTPVHVLYMTAVSDAAGVRFLDDIYERDTAILTGLNRKANSR
ncbi:peptidoglycan-binding protein [Algimonas arctica]|uniref:Peptidoglycan-binding protein n=2 Tax=Algimonas arctica TaxID=1479486 RepID=A0A8J3CPN1_9PROT|nr:peptidoglycan-binding protein [Algimonas arctica]